MNAVEGCFLLRTKQTKGATVELLLKGRTENKASENTDSLGAEQLTLVCCSHYG